MNFFGVNLPTLFGKLDHFFVVQNFFTAMKQSSLQKRVSKFSPKYLYRIYPWPYS
jgi:hypothetical protein